MSDIFTDYADRFSHQNTDPTVAIMLLESVHRSDADTDILFVDWRIPEQAQGASIFLGHVGLRSSESGMPMYDDGFVSAHKTSKYKLFVNFETPHKTTAGLKLFVAERRFILPNEGMIAVCSLFRVSMYSLRPKKQD